MSDVGADIFLLVIDGLWYWYPHSSSALWYGQVAQSRFFVGRKV